VIGVEGGRMRKYKVRAIKTRYWIPGDSYLGIITDAIRNIVRDNDFVALSEKAISTALGNIVDESSIKPGWLARFIAKYWMRIFWGLMLGSVSRLSNRTIENIRRYPMEEGSAHKQLVLKHVGFLRALMYGSEGGIDGSNLPYSYVNLPLKNARVIAQEIRKHIHRELKKNVAVMIVDTDNTYSTKGFHFTHRIKPINGIHSLGGFLAYVIGRFFKFKRRATPIAMVGSDIGVEEALEIASMVNKSRGFGAGKNVWEMAKRFGVSVTDVSWNMLKSLKHKPIVIVRQLKNDKE
jgi:F420-0:gamma-glutamyl ligase-like protein